MNNADSTLHILNKEPDHPRFRACQEAFSDGDQLLLIENAVVALADGECPLPDGTLALAADCIARGLADNHRVGLVDFDEMVTLTVRYGRIISW